MWVYGRGRSQTCRRERTHSALGSFVNSLSMTPWQDQIISMSGCVDILDPPSAHKQLQFCTTRPTATTLQNHTTLRVIGLSPESTLRIGNSFRSQWVSSLEVSKGHISNILMSSFPPNGGQNELTTRRAPSLQTHVALRIGFSASDVTDVFESLCWGLRLWNLFEVLKFTWTIWNYKKLDFKSNLSKNTLILPKQTSEVLTFRQVMPDL